MGRIRLQLRLKSARSHRICRIVQPAESARQRLGCRLGFVLARARKYLLASKPALLTVLLHGFLEAEDAGLRYGTCATHCVFCQDPHRVTALDLRADNSSVPSGGWSNPQIFNSIGELNGKMEEKS
jgi:hypothetical protein